MSVNPFDSGVAVAVPVPPLWQRVLEALGPAFVDAAGPVLPSMVQALLAPLEDVDELVTDERGYASLFNLDDSPIPGWLGQWVGVAYDPALSLDQQRARVRSRGQTRGTPTSMLSAVLPFVSTSDGVGGVTDRNVQLLERTAADGSPAPYRFVVQVYAAQVGTAGNIAALQAAVTAVKPVGLLWLLRIVAGWTYDEALSRGGTYDSETDGVTTYDQDSRVVPSTAGLARYSDETSVTDRYSADTLRSYDRDLAAD